MSNYSYRFTLYKFMSSFNNKVFDMVVPERDHKFGLIFTVSDRPGALLQSIKIFSDKGINMSYISSKPSLFSNGKKKIDFFVDLEGNPNDQRIKQAIDDLKSASDSLKVCTPIDVPWFPKNIDDLNLSGKDILNAGVDLESDHPGFNDEMYRNRRKEIASISNSYNLGDERIPEVKYTQEENELWEFIYNKLEPLHKKYACKEFNNTIEAFQNEGIFSKNRIPQLDNLNKFLNRTSNWSYKPVDGLLSQREFLNGLAFRVFYSTQYIRHKKVPLYTPEPDIIHEFLGHAPLFADKEFCQFSQEIGLASLGASDEDILKLGTIYWFTIEFGLCMEDKQKKCYGAGILSSPAEIEWALSDKPEFREFDLFKIAVQPYNITEIQKIYFLAPSFKIMTEQVRKYAESIKKPFNITYNMNKNTVDIDRNINIIE